MALFHHGRYPPYFPQHKGLSHISLDDSRTNFLVRPLGRESAKFLSDLTNSKEFTPFFNNSLNESCLMRMCLLFPLYTLFMEIPITA